MVESSLHPSGGVIPFSKLKMLFTFSHSSSSSLLQTNTIVTKFDGVVTIKVCMVVGSSVLHTKVLVGRAALPKFKAALPKN